jgi:hypothetical protein
LMVPFTPGLPEIPTKQITRSSADVLIFGI